MHKKIIAASLAALAAASAAANPDKINWGSVPKSEIVLFYPGQSTSEWMNLPR